MVLGPPAYVSDPSVPAAASGLEIKEAILVDLPSQEAVQLWDRIEALLGDASIRAIKVEDLELRPDDSEGRLLFVLDGQDGSRALQGPAPFLGRGRPTLENPPSTPGTSGRTRITWR